MRLYFYAENDQQFGPFNLEELKTKRLKKSTLIWTEGMPNWEKAEEIAELKSIIIPEPPPLPKKQTNTANIETIHIKKPYNNSNSSKYDLTYEKETEATFFGILLIAIPLIVKLTGIITFGTEESYNNTRALLAIGSIVLRILVTAWVVRISSSQNRNTTGWGCFAFIFPSIALIVIGQLKKLKLKIELDGSIPPKRQAAILYDKANRLFSDNRFSECIEILNKAIEIENHNFESIKLRGLSQFRMKNFDAAKLDFETLIKNDKFSSFANLYLGNIASVNKDRELAITYYQKASDLKNESAKIMLDLFQTYTGNYVLENSQIEKKLTNDLVLNFNDGKYLGGIDQIDQNETLSNFITDIKCYKNGIKIMLWKKSKEYNICIAYYEIDNILYKEFENLFELHLIDRTILSFSYDQTKDYNNGLKFFCNHFKIATGKNPSASTAWND